MHKLAACPAFADLHGKRRKIAKHVVPDTNSDRLEDAQRDEFRRLRHADTLCGESETEQDERQENRPVHECNELVIDVGVRPLSYAADHS